MGYRRDTRFALHGALPPGLPTPSPSTTSGCAPRPHPPDAPRRWRCRRQLLDEAAPHLSFDDGSTWHSNGPAFPSALLQHDFDTGPTRLQHRVSDVFDAQMRDAMSTLFRHYPTPSVTMSKLHVRYVGKFGGRVSRRRWGGWMGGRTVGATFALVSSRSAKILLR